MRENKNVWRQRARYLQMAAGKRTGQACVHIMTAIHATVPGLMALGSVVPLHRTVIAIAAVDARSSEQGAAHREKQKNA
jgi:hypothetical protein